MDLSDLHPDIRAAAWRVRQGSASDPGSDRFRAQLAEAISNTGQEAPAELIDAIDQAMQNQTFSQYA